MSFENPLNNSYWEQMGKIFQTPSAAPNGSNTFGEDFDVSILSSSVDNSLAKIDFFEKSLGIDSAEFFSDIVSGSTNTNTEPANPELVSIINNSFTPADAKSKMDTDGDGKISREELIAFIEEMQGSNEALKDFKIEDFQKAITEWNSELGKMLEEGSKPELEEGQVDYAVPNAGAEVPSESMPSSLLNSPGAASSSGANSPSNWNPYVPGTETKQQERTPDVIQQDISTKENEKNNINTNAQGEINAQEQTLNQAIQSEMEANKIDEKIQQEFNTKTQEFNVQIAEKETQINEQDSIIQDSQAAIDAKTTAISSIEGQIASLQSAIGEADDTKNTEIQTKISNLETEKKRLQSEKDAAQKTLDTATAAKSELETQKAQLEQDKAALLENMAIEHPQLQKVVDAVKELQAETQQNVQDIKTVQKSLIDSLNNDIQTLKTELTQSQQTQETNKILKDNSVEQYSKEFGAGLADAAINAANKRNTTGLCYAGVKDALETIYGQRMEGGSAYMAADIFRNDSFWSERFTEASEQVPKEELANLPPGTVVVWDKGGSNVSAAGKKHGHISISLGNGQEASDHVQKQTWQRDAKYTVFYPTGIV